MEPRLNPLWKTNIQKQGDTQLDTSEWGFPKKGGTPSYHPFIDGIFHYKPTILG